MSQVQKFYSGKDVFVTGATGFVGKVLLQKLLRAFPDIGIVYFLLRPKHNQTPKDRLEKLLKSKAFSRVNPDDIKKLVPIVGDICEDRLGLSNEDEKTLSENVSVVFHFAAAVRFDQPLKASINQNYMGTKRVLELCLKMTNLKALVHVSTAYSNCEREEINEVVYPTKMDPDDVVKCVNLFNDEIVDNMTPILLGEKPNTYIYTKSLAEVLVARHSDRIPVAIIRPSIVIASWKDPIPGWIDTMNGPAGLSIAVGKGILRSFPVDKNKVVDFIPVDMIINHAIVVGWKTATDSPYQMAVYNNTSGTLNPMTWGDYGHLAVTHYLRNPMLNVLWYPSTTFFQGPMNHVLKDLFVHYIPAKAIDAVRKASGKKPRMMKFYNKLLRIHRALEVFTKKEWRFHNDNTMAMWNSLSPEDKELFPFDVSSVHWPTFIAHCMAMGVKCLDDMDFDRIPEARRHLRKLYWVQFLVHGLCLALLVQLLCTLFGVFS